MERAKSDPWIARAWVRPSPAMEVLSTRVSACKLIVRCASAHLASMHAEQAPAQVRPGLEQLMLPQKAGAQEAMGATARSAAVR